MAFLNAVAANKRIMAVTRVEVENEAGIPKMGAAKTATALPGFGAVPAGAPAAPPSPPPSHEERVVAGRELIKAKVEVEIFRFVAEPPQETSS